MAQPFVSTAEIELMTFCQFKKVYYIYFELNTFINIYFAEGAVFSQIRQSLISFRNIIF